MSLLAAWVLYPLILLALCVGLGLLVDVASGRRLPGVLVPPIGLAAIVVVGQFTTMADATAELTVPVLAAGAVLGAGLALPWRFGRPDPWPVAVAVSVFAVFGAPVLLSGEPTFAGYVKLDDTATWMALTDRVMEHGRSLEGLEPSTYRATLEFNLAGGYPVGVFIPYGAAQKLLGGDLAWVFQPYLSFLAAMLALSLWRILTLAGSALRRPGPRALAVFIASQPALLFGYALWGGIKELAAAALVALAAALAPAAVAPERRPADAALLALAAAALVGVLSLGGLVWLGPMLAVLAALSWRRFGPPEAGVQALEFLVVLALLVVPVVSSGLLPPTSSPLTDASAEGNLAGPLDFLQVLGIWPSGDFRFAPGGTVATAMLVALGLVAAAAGLLLAFTRRQLALLLFASALVSCVAIVLVGSPWAGGKALATASPVALALAIVGAIAVARADRVTAAALIAVVAGGVVWSNALAYGGVNLAPYERLAELEEIGEDFAGQGPALMTEYNPYGARHFLRELDAEGAAELRVRPVALRGGGIAEKGQSVDPDEVDPEALFVYRTLVTRRSPVASRPPLPYELVRSGEHYDVWQRPRAPEAPVLSHLPLGGEEAAGALPDCGEVTGLGLLALSNQLGWPPQSIRIVGVPAPPVHDATDGAFRVPRAGRYRAWLGGSVRGGVELLIDGDPVGEAHHRLNNEGGFVDLGELRLARGAHTAELRFGGADLHPGSGGFPRPATGPLLIAPAGAEATDAVLAAAPGEADRLCGRRLDWVEAIGAAN